MLELTIAARDGHRCRIKSGIASPNGTFQRRIGVRTVRLRVRAPLAITPEFSLFRGRIGPVRGARTRW